MTGCQEPPGAASGGFSCLVADVDGTLVDGDGAIFAGVLELMHLRESGLRIVLCSARPLRSLAAFSGQIGGVDLISASQGAVLAQPTHKPVGWQVVSDNSASPIRAGTGP